MFRCFYTSDLQGMRTIAKRDGDDWILNGSKTFITNGWMAGCVIVCAVTNPEAKSPAHGISLFLVQDDMPGFKKGRKLEKLGFKAQVSHLVALLLKCYLVFTGYVFIWTVCIASVKGYKIPSVSMYKPYVCIDYAPNIPLIWRTFGYSCLNYMPIWRVILWQFFHAAVNASPWQDLKVTCFTVIRRCFDTSELGAKKLRAKSVWQVFMAVWDYTFVKLQCLIQHPE